MEVGLVVAIVTARDAVNCLYVVFRKNTPSGLANNHIRVNSLYPPVPIEGSNYFRILLIS